MNDKLKKIKMLLLDVDGTMTDAGIYINEDGSQFKKFNARDGIGIRMLMKKGVDVGIISHSLSKSMVDTRSNMLGMKHCYVGQEDKVKILMEWSKKLGIVPSEFAYIGDDVNDLSIMNAVGFTACPNDALPAVKDFVDVVLKLKGGDGCVREFIDNYLMN
jgi:3-deoxy-D-manno-octulosonate 8-phosphate phosphatase (KDO 8-P phosphatase)